MIDFVAPYFDQSGISILLRKKEPEQSIFKFMSVLKWEVWLGILGAVIVVSLLIWCSSNGICYKKLDRFSVFIKYVFNWNGLAFCNKRWNWLQDSRPILALLLLQQQRSLPGGKPWTERLVATFNLRMRLPHCVPFRKNLHWFIHNQRNYLIPNRNAKKKTHS